MAVVFASVAARDKYVHEMSVFYEQYGREQCCVLSPNCAGREVQWHHVWPRAYGGERLPQVPLCSAHHQQVHTIAKKMIAQARRGKETSFVWPRDSDAEQIDARLANMLVTTIVLAKFNPITVQGKVVVTLDDRTLARTRLAVNRAGSTPSLEAVLKVALLEYLNKRGL